MFLLNEHCMTPSTSLQAISSRVPYKHKSFSTLSKDLLKAQHAPNPDPLRFLALRLEERALSSVSFLSFPHQRTPRVFFNYPSLSLCHLANVIFPSEPDLPRSSTQARKSSGCANPAHQQKCWRTPWKPAGSRHPGKSSRLLRKLTSQES